MIDNLQVDGDFIESQAFAYLAIRSIFNFLYHFHQQLIVKNLVLGGI